MSIGLWLLSILSVALEGSVVAAIIRSRQVRRFPLVLAVCVWGMITVVLSTAVIRAAGYDSRGYASFYYATDLVVHGLIIALVLSLIEQSIPDPRSATRVVTALALGVVIFGLGSLWAYYIPGPRVWVINLSRNLSFCEEVLNFILWGALIRNRGRDMTLLFVSAGIGLQVTGEVIGNTLRVFLRSSSLMWLPTLLVVGSEMICLVIWFYAFWNYPAQGEKRNSASTHG